MSAHNQDLWRITMEIVENQNLKNTINIKNNSVDRINSRLDKLKRRLFADKLVEYNKIKVRKVKERK